MASPKTVSCLVGVFAFALMAVAAQAAEPASKKPLAVDDLYLMDGPQSVVIAPDKKRAAYIRRWIDRATQEERFSLWLSEGDNQRVRPLEAGEPDARQPVFSPDGQWIAVRSTRGRPAGWKQTPSVPRESEPATDIWLVAVDGSRSLPLAGPNKPYGRVFHDPFYGRVAFSPDGKRLVFVADDGRDPRTPDEIAADVYVVRPDQGEGYTGYGTAQIWLAELDRQPGEFAAREIRRLTEDDVWYGDPQWAPSGKYLVCHANKTNDVESVRYSINKNYDLWAIEIETGKQQQLTTGPGAEISPRISADGRQLVCLSSPRKGPHADVYNLLRVPLAAALGSPEQHAASRVVFDHHGAGAERPPHPVPAFPLPDDCWQGPQTILYTTFAGTATDTIVLDLETGMGAAVSLENGGNTPRGYQERTRARQRLTPAGNRILADRLKADERLVTWENDGLQLEGVLTLPPSEVAQPPYPLVVYPHGGPHSRSTQGFNFTVQIFAANGYAVFQPNFRGSSGYGRKFLDADRNDLGGGDMRDILTGIESLVKDKLVNPERQFVYGISYGGYMTCWLVGHTNQFRAAVAQNAVTDMNVMWGLSDIQSWTQWELQGLPWEVPDAMRKHSPISYVEKITRPTLILHSRDDRRCPLPMGRMFYQALRARGVPTQMVVYPNEGHGIRQPRHQADVLRRTLAWFKQYDTP
jgi:dipeptidyl aminopeptidase/acylaminoacyl peptidase